MSDAENEEAPRKKKTCSGLKDELIACLQNSDCMKKVGVSKTSVEDFIFSKVKDGSKKVIKGKHP